jgi:hypothetical protein
MAVSYPIIILSWATNVGIPKDLQARQPRSVQVKHNKDTTHHMVAACTSLSSKVESVV